MSGRDDQHVFVEVAPGGLLLDLASGTVFALNDSASFVWRLSLEGQSPSRIVRSLMEKYGIDESTAMTCAQSALAPKPTSVAATDHRRDFGYERSTFGYVQSFKGRPVLELDSEGRRLRRLPADRDADTRTIRVSIYALIPKLLALRGHMVLHASAVSVATGALLFCGRSQAGKTTTARALVSNGAAPISEDKVLLRTVGSSVAVVATAESVSLDWARHAANRLERGEEVLCGEIDAAAEGDTIPVAELGIIDAARRTLGDLTATRLNSLEGAGSVFSSTFHGSDTREHWTRQLETCAAVARQVPTYELTMPEGVSSLSSAAAGLVTRGSLTS